MTLTDVLPSGVTFVSASSSQGTTSLTGGTVTASLGSLADGASATVTIVVTTIKAGTINNTATVVGNESDPDPGNNSTTLSTSVAAFNPLVVINTEDGGPGSLRAAITYANSNPGPDAISFAIPARDIPGVVDYDPTHQVWHIQTNSALPTITDTVTIDGYSQNSLAVSQASSSAQLLTLGGVVTGGTFTLTFDAETTAPIPFNATANQVSLALRPCQPLAQGNVAVAADANNDTANAGVLTITFQNQLANTSIPIIGDASGLTGTAPTVSVTSSGSKRRRSEHARGRVRRDRPRGP